MFSPLILLHLAAFTLCTSHVAYDHDEKVLKSSNVEGSYRLGERFAVECLNRTLDTGEHVSDTMLTGLSELFSDIVADTRQEWGAPIYSLPNL